MKNPLGDRPRVPGRHKNSGDSIQDQLRTASRCAADDGFPHGHGLKEHEGGRLGSDPRVDKDIHCSHDLRDIPTPAGKQDVLMEIQLFDEALQAPLVGR